MHRFVRAVPIAAAACLLSGALLPGSAKAATHHEVTGYAEFQEAQLTPVGKLGTSKIAELLDQRLMGPSPTSTAVGFTLRQARTGKAVWTRTLALLPDDYLTVLPTAVGKPARRGLVVIDTPDGFSFGTVALQMWALNGTTGKVEWTRTFNESSTGGTTSDIPSYDGVLRAPAGRAQNFLITLGAESGGSSYATQADVIRGSDGSEVDLGAAVDTANDPASFTPLPDVNGDGYGDVLVAEDGSPGVLIAESGLTAAQIWTQVMVDVSELPYTGTSAFVYDLGNFGSAHQLIVETGGPTEDRLDAYELNARTGGGAWSHQVAGINVLGRAGPHRAPAFGYFNVSGATAGSTYTTTVTWTAVGVSGATIYRHHATVSAAIPKASEGADSNGDVGVIGDLQPDGVKDLSLQMEAYAYSSSVQRDIIRYGVIDGRTGVYHPSPAYSVAAGSLRHGAGTDLLATGISRGHPTVTAWRGSTRARYYRRVLTGLSGWTAAWVTGVRASGHSCSDLSLVVENGGHGVLTVLSARGAPLWSVRYSASQAVGGTLHHYPTPRHYCVP